MDNLIFDAITGYYNVLCKLGQYSYKDTLKILLLCFYRDFVFSDYYGILSREDYHEIEKALNCLFGSNCLIPYPDYLKMGKLHIGEMTEMAYRLRVNESAKVLKAGDLMQPDASSDIMIVEDEEE